MKTYTSLFFLLFLWSISLSAQSKIGLEIRSSVNRTYNQGVFVSNYYLHGFEGYSQDEVLKERNLNSISYSFGVVWSINPQNRFKLYLGRHRNGRIFDIDEEGSGYIQDVENFKMTYNFINYYGSYSQVVNINKHYFPIEIGLSINKIIDRSSQRWFFIEGLNYDLVSRVGYERALFTNFCVGFNVVYTHAIKNYSLDENISQNQEQVAIYIPYQFGLEAVIRYDFQFRK